MANLSASQTEFDLHSICSLDWKNLKKKFKKIKYNNADSATIVLGIKKSRAVSANSTTTARPQQKPLKIINEVSIFEVEVGGDRAETVTGGRVSWVNKLQRHRRLFKAFRPFLSGHVPVDRMFRSIRFVLSLSANLSTRPPL